MEPTPIRPPRRAPWIAIAVAAAVLAGCSDASPAPDLSAEPPTTRPPDGQASAGTATSTPVTAAPSRPARPDRRRAPDLRVTSFDGETITLGGFRGMPVVVNFFESW